MSLPLWDPIEIPPDFTLVDINSLEPEELRLQLQSEALELWVEDQGLDWDDPIARDWKDDEGMFAVYDTNGEIVGVTLIVDSEDA